MVEIISAVVAGIITAASAIASIAIIEKFFNNIISNWLLKEITNRFDVLEQKVDVNEKDRLKTEIINYANDLRNGESKTDVQYKLLCETEQKYRKLHGNTYAEFELKYIHEVNCNL